MKKLLIRIGLALLIVYLMYTFINQQKTLNSYKSTQAYYEEQIQEQNEYNEVLAATKANINSKEYIEEMAREKLDMYLPNERVYADIEN